MKTKKKKKRPNRNAQAQSTATNPKTAASTPPAAAGITTAPAALLSSVAEAAAELAERLRTALGELSIQAGDAGSIHITASFGIAALDGAHPVEDSVQRADEAMYRAKKAGRNRTEVDRSTVAGA